MNASLIIPTYNREDLLIQTLHCALQQESIDYEIVLIDQTPRHAPETEEFLKTHAARIRRFSVEPPSLTKARNAGIRHATGDVLVFVDDDTTFERDFLRRHLAAHEEGADVVQGRVMEEGAHIADRPIWISWRLKYSGSNTSRSQGKTNSITGCNFSIDRHVVDKIGYFDERFQGLATREDSDYGLRAHRAGLTMRFAPEAAVFHHRSSAGGVAGAIGEQFFEPSYYVCELLFARRHFPKPVASVYRFRLFLRGVRQVRKLIAHADRHVTELLQQTD